jgi:DMSO/TMAO reductase YedYZ molybdopterin-dependent catalytic subunit
MPKTPSLDLPRTLGLRAILAGVAGLAGSYAVAGQTPTFVAAPIESWLAATVPDVLLRIAITIVTPLGESLGIEHLGQALNLGFALVLGVGLLSALALAALATGRVRGDRATTVALALVLPWLAVFVLTADLASALGAGLASAVVVSLGELADSGLVASIGAADAAGADTDGGRRDLLGSLAGAVVVALGGFFIGNRSAGSETARSPQPLSELGGNRSANATHAAGTDTATPTENGPNAGNSGDGSGPDGTETDGTDEANGDGEADGNGGGSPAGIDQLLATARRRSLSVPDLEGLLSGEDFYEVDINSIDPDVRAADWSLSISGAVENEISIGYDDLTSMAAEHRFATLRCVSDTLNGAEADTALWTGVPVSGLLERAESTGKHLRIDAADDYFQGFSIDELENAMIVYGMDGMTLPRGHGAPVRLLVPGHWGEIQVKWLESIEVRTQPVKGFWERRGWHGTGEAHTVAKLHARNRLGDGRVQVGGHAYAGARGVKRVELSIDGGDWRETELSKPLPAAPSERERGLPAAEAAWRQWTHTYDPPDAAHEVRVRAVEADGTIQPREVAEPYPRGATGWVSVTVEP